jgi:pullulanase
MKKTQAVVWILIGVSLSVGSCSGTVLPPDSQSGADVSSGIDSSGIVSSSASSSSQGSAIQSSSSSSGSSDYGADVVFKGLVKIYYHDDDASVYSSKRLWVWGTGVNGSEYPFDNQASPDNYGLYKIFDMSAEPFSEYDQTAMRFIVKKEGTWSGQSPDIVTGFNKYTSEKTTLDGRDLLTIYCVDEGASVETYAAESDALGDRLSKAEFTSWTTVSCAGTGTQGARSAAEVGLCDSYRLYGYSHDYYLLNSDEQAAQKEDYFIVSGAPKSNAWSVTLPNSAVCSSIYSVEAVFESDTGKTKSKSVSWLKLYDDAKFISTYTYPLKSGSGNDLGYHYVNGQNVFKLWAPTAGRVLVNIYPFGTPKNLLGSHDVTETDVHDSYDMDPGAQGVWTFATAAEIQNEFYTYTVYTPEGSFETIDPYAKSSGVNGIRGAIISGDGFSKLDPTGFRDSLTALSTEYPLARPNQLSVYEMHVRDFTADSTWISNQGNKGGTFNALCESGTTYGNGSTVVSTGFDSLKELGVQAVQLLPVFDQDNDERTYVTYANGVAVTHYPDYNWGYNPLNYDIVEGAYSSNPKDPRVRVKEFKNLVKTCADSGIRVIMDVVYNHMSSTSNNAFNKIMPKYYFLTDSNGYYYDETGCNNTLATGRAMVRSFIVDSVSWWAKEYGVKGFRFDLMGAIEGATMREVKNALYDIDPSIVVYGEGWRVAGDSTTQAVSSVVYSTLGASPTNHKGSVGCFNAGGRDGLKGETQDGHPAYGFMTQGRNGAGTGWDFSANTWYNAACAYLGEDRYTTQNGISTPAAQTVNYVSCHDNFTLYDSLNYCRNVGVGASSDNEDAKKASLACSAYILLSQGIAFFQGGEELFRQKLLRPGETHYDDVSADDYCLLPDNVKMVRNSYQYGDGVNAFKWDRKLANYDYFCKFAEAFKERKALVTAGLMGVEQPMISSNKSELWGSVIVNGAPTQAIVAAQTHFSDGDFYVFLGGRMDGATENLSIGNGTLSVLYDSASLHDAGSNLAISSGALAIGKYEFLVARRLS